MFCISYDLSLDDLPSWYLKPHFVEDRERAGAESFRQREKGVGHRPYTTSSHPVVSPAPKAATEEAKAKQHNEKVHDYHSLEFG
jgi:hypothetical protein